MDTDYGLSAEVSMIEDVDVHRRNVNLFFRNHLEIEDQLRRGTTGLLGSERWTVATYNVEKDDRLGKVGILFHVFDGLGLDFVTTALKDDLWTVDVRQLESFHVSNTPSQDL